MLRRRSVLTALTPATPRPWPARPAPPAPAAARPRPYVFTQQHHDNLWWWDGTWLPQTVPAGARIQIQLPADPFHWIPGPPGHCPPTGAGTLVPLRARARLLDRYVLPDRDRIPGTSTIEVFDYRLDGPGAVAVCLHPHPEPDTPEQLGLPPGSPTGYVLTLLAGIPQTELSVP